MNPLRGALGQPDPAVYLHVPGVLRDRGGGGQEIVLRLPRWHGTHSARPITVSDPNKISGTRASQPITASPSQSTSGTPLAAVVFHLNGHESQVLGINVSLTVVEHVAAGLIQ